MARSYELKERARKQDETRQRIVEATSALHAEVGPARTTVAEIARRAGVGRVTVYNHFPDESELFAACSAHFVGSSPPPGVTGDLRQTLASRYAYFRANEAMIANVTRDAASMPALAEVLRPAVAAEAALRDALAEGRGREARALIGLALAFETWRRLVREGLSDPEAVDVMVGVVAAVSRDERQLRH